MSPLPKTIAKSPSLQHMMGMCCRTRASQPSTPKQAPRSSHSPWVRLLGNSLRLVLSRGTKS